MAGGMLLGLATYLHGYHHLLAGVEENQQRVTTFSGADRRITLALIAALSNLILAVSPPMSADGQISAIWPLLSVTGLGIAFLCLGPWPSSEACASR